MDYYKDVFGMPTDSSWLRYLYVDTPYTAYINNRVTLTLVLDILVLYTYGRIRRLAYFDDPVTGPLVDMENPVPLPKYSTTRDLFTFTSPGHPLRTASKSRQIFVIFYIFICVMATAAMVIWKLHQWVPDFWKMSNLVVSIVSEGSFRIVEAVCGDAEDWHAWGAVAGTDLVLWVCHCCSAVAESA
ncbi:unnamed protein product [Alternaria alternata]